MLGMGMNVANIIIISYFTIEGSYLKQIYMVLHDTYIGYMISLSCVEILKYVLFFGFAKNPSLSSQLPSRARSLRNF